MEYNALALLPLEYNALALLPLEYNASALDSYKRPKLKRWTPINAQS
ncbi:MAG: hypothetical protein KAI83_14305 [Thiomargarita sp.]|nr:hypothetical protein [Thiomargarita sp.]